MDQALIQLISALQDVTKQLQDVSTGLAVQQARENGAILPGFDLAGIPGMDYDGFMDPQKQKEIENQKLADAIAEGIDKNQDKNAREKALDDFAPRKIRKDPTPINVVNFEKRALKQLASIIPPSCCNVIKENIKKKEEDSGFKLPNMPNLPGLGSLLKYGLPALVGGVGAFKMYENWPKITEKFDELKRFLKEFNPKSLIPDGMLKFYNEQIGRINADWKIFQDDVQKINTPKVQTKVPTEVMETVPNEVKTTITPIDKPGTVEIPVAPPQIPASEPILKDGQQLTDLQTDKPLTDVVAAPVLENAPISKNVEISPPVETPIDVDPHVAPVVKTVEKVLPKSTRVVDNPGLAPVPERELAENKVSPRNQPVEAMDRKIQPGEIDEMVNNNKQVVQPKTTSQQIIEQKPIENKITSQAQKKITNVAGGEKGFFVEPDAPAAVKDPILDSTTRNRVTTDVSNVISDKNLAKKLVEANPDTISTNNSPGSRLPGEVPSKGFDIPPPSGDRGPTTRNELLKDLPENPKINVPEMDKSSPNKLVQFFGDVFGKDGYISKLWQGIKDSTLYKLISKPASFVLKKILLPLDIAIASVKAGDDFMENVDQGKNVESATSAVRTFLDSFVLDFVDLIGKGTGWVLEKVGMEMTGESFSKNVTGLTNAIGNSIEQLGTILDSAIKLDLELVKDDVKKLGTDVFDVVFSTVGIAVDSIVNSVKDWTGVGDQENAFSFKGETEKLGAMFTSGLTIMTNWISDTFNLEKYVSHAKKFLENKAEEWNLPLWIREAMGIQKGATRIEAGGSLETRKFIRDQSPEVQEQFKRNEEFAANTQMVKTGQIDPNTSKMWNADFVAQRLKKDFSDDKTKQDILKHIQENGVKLDGNVIEMKDIQSLSLEQLRKIEKMIDTLASGGAVDRLYAEQLKASEIGTAVGKELDKRRSLFGNDRPIYMGKSTPEGAPEDQSQYNSFQNKIKVLEDSYADQISAGVKKPKYDVKLSSADEMTDWMNFMHSVPDQAMKKMDIKFQHVDDIPLTPPTGVGIDITEAQNSIATSGEEINAGAKKLNEATKKGWPPPRSPYAWEYIEKAGENINMGSKRIFAESSPWAKMGLTDGHDNKLLPQAKKAPDVNTPKLDKIAETMAENTEIQRQTLELMKGTSGDGAQGSNIVNSGGNSTTINNTTVQSDIMDFRNRALGRIKCL